ncbi:hypothetical protein EV421DRAFT_1738343 [Armillaria borealis]|uniref:Uncharacterized protein n=1 Tax=Armillaria borealis TaxID=47425 RepID=A0AA39JDG1_9AGAR|nr:hypothetical protein EV421DRAFT_1738343 [Armillaria borealis]
MSGQRERDDETTSVLTPTVKYLSSYICAKFPDCKLGAVLTVNSVGILPVETGSKSPTKFSKGEHYFIHLRMFPQAHLQIRAQTQAQALYCIDLWIRALLHQHLALTTRPESGQESRRPTSECNPSAREFTLRAESPQPPRLSSSLGRVSRIEYKDVKLKRRPLLHQRQRRRDCRIRILEVITFSPIATNNTVGDARPLIATILVDYTDGTTETIVTDMTWKTLQSVPPSAGRIRALMIQRGLQLSRSCREPRRLGVAPFVHPPAINMTAAHWIWTNETDANGWDPVGHRAFRDLITSPYGKVVVCGKVVFGADNIGHGGNRHSESMEAYSIPDMDPNVNVFAVDGERPAYIWYTDSTWKTFIRLPDGFEPHALEECHYPVGLREKALHLPLGLHIPTFSFSYWTLAFCVFLLPYVSALVVYPFFSFKCSPLKFIRESIFYSIKYKGHCQLLCTWPESIVRNSLSAILQLDAVDSGN